MRKTFGNLIMPVKENINQNIVKFRLASRELFNHYFHQADPYNEDGWNMLDRFTTVENILFQELVLKAANLPILKYGETQPGISVKLASGESAPILVNREVDSGYWDYPIKEINTRAGLIFQSFFDWDQLNYKDNRYVRVLISQWEDFPDTTGKFALIESQYVVYELKQI